MTGVDRVDSEDIFELTDRVEIFSGVNGENEFGGAEAPEARERLDGRPELLSFRGRLLSEDTAGDSKASGTPEDS